jgi:hypothetical protein
VYIIFKLSSSLQDLIESHRQCGVFVRYFMTLLMQRSYAAKVVDRTSTFDEIVKELREGDEDRWTVLQAHYGHEPGWTVCESTATIEATCHILYAVDNTSGLDCVLALIRTSSYDYPLPICEHTPFVLLYF